MLKLNRDCFNHVISYLSLYHIIILSRVTKSLSIALENTLKNHPALPSPSFWVNWFDKSPRVKLIKRVHEALRPQANPKLPLDYPGSLRQEFANDYRLIVYKTHVDIFKKKLLGWGHEIRMTSPKINHFLCGEDTLVYFDDYRVIAKSLSLRQDQLYDYDKKHPVLRSKNFFCFAKGAHTFLHSKTITKLNYVGFNFILETETHLHLIAKTFILHIELKTKSEVYETIDVPEVLRAKEDWLICKSEIIQIGSPKSHIIYKI